MEQDLSQIIGDFANNPNAGGRLMRQLLDTDQKVFTGAALEILRRTADSQGIQYLITLLLMNDLVLQPLVDPALFSLEEAIRIAKMALRLEPFLDIKMVRSLVDQNMREDDLARQMASGRGIRLLEILGAISDGARILPVMAQLLNHPDAWVRSKAALLVGRSNKNYKWVEQRQAERDPRVRANAIESLWGVDSEGSRNVLWGALGDSDNRVIGNALLGLHRLGDATCVPLILDMSKHLSPEFRISAIWVMGETGDQRFTGVLARFFGDPDAKIRTAAFRAVAKLKEAVKGSAAAAAELRLICVEPSQSSVTMLLSAWIRNEEVQPLSGIKPTQVVLYENSHLVTDYEVEEVSHAEAVSIAFALPRIGESGNPFQRTCEAAFQQALKHKRKADSWLVIKYLRDKEPSASPVPATAPANDRTLLHLNAPEAAAPVRSEELPLPPHARFTTSREAIAESVRALGTRMSLPLNLRDATRMLLPAVAHCRGSRHLVLFETPGTTENNPDAWSKFGQQAARSKVPVHAIVLAHSPDLKQLCAKTGGIYFNLMGIEDIPAALESLCAGILNRYRITYRSPLPDAASGIHLKVQVYCPRGLGEATASGAAVPVPEHAMALAG